MATIIISILIALAVFFSIRYSLKQKGACGDCHVSCPIKEEMAHSQKEK
ncbi:FeoB-associated Cys-rich membrane protein [Streptococcus gallolyticus]|nr:FeoB-associated Cys-rich membrane protein [Streptococcus gallolyticus]MBY5040320.1 FeoB-associated Cys-rich membrane protein [Streptococcus gallolyticus]